MRIGNWLGGSVIWALAATMSMAAGAGTAEHVTTVPLGGSLDGQSGDHYYRRLCSDAIRRRAQDQDDGGPGRRFEAGPTATAQGQRPGHRLRPAGLVYLQGRRRQEALHGRRPRFVQVGQSTKKPWNFYYWPTKADSIHEPWAGGNGRVDTMRPERRRRMCSPRRAAISPRGWISSWPGPTGCSKRCPLPATTRPGSPTFMMIWTWVGPDKEHGGQITRFQTPSPLLKYDQLFGTSARQWEAAFSQNKDISRWPGHCLGGAVASILLNEPMPAPGAD